MSHCTGTYTQGVIQLSPSHTANPSAISSDLIRQVTSGEGEATVTVASEKKTRTVNSIYL